MEGRLRARPRLGALARHVITAQKDSEKCPSPCLVAGLGLPKRILVANRGEIAIRICRAAADLGVETVAVFSEDDSRSLHTTAADRAEPLSGTGVPAYLDIDGLLKAAKSASCDAVHPGYGFLSESAEFAQRCAQAGLLFIGPPVEMLQLFGDKSRARSAAAAAGVPVMRGINRPVTLEEARDFLQSLGPGAGVMVKALAGAGGRGSRAASSVEELEEVYKRCRSEASMAFGGEGEVYVEEFLAEARHIEVQVLADNAGNVVDLGERECTLQRRYQKLIEIAPAAHLDAGLRRELIQAAVRLASSVGYRNVGTFEFLVQGGQPGRTGRFAFIEANARLQVEHTVTEQVTGVDICMAQIRLASGALLSDLGLIYPGVGDAKGRAIQARVNMETLLPDGNVRPSAGVLAAYDPPGGPGVRVDGCGYTGYETSPSFDSLLAKVVVHTPSQELAVAASRTARALGEFRVQGLATNIPFLQTLLRHPAFLEGQVHTRFVDEHLKELVENAATYQVSRLFPQEGTHQSMRDEGFAGAQVDSAKDPLALFSVAAQSPGASSSRLGITGGDPASPVPAVKGPPGTLGIVAPIQGKVLSIAVAVGDVVRMGQRVAVLEAMKMEHDIKADQGGIVRLVTMAVGDIVREGFPLLFVEESDAAAGAEETEEAVDLDFIRPDLALLYERRAFTLDANRPKAVARRRATGQRTARENIEDLCDPGSFVEYGPLVVAWQRKRRTRQWLQENSPADGLVMGVGTVNAHLFNAQRARCVAVAYDYTVLAGTQGGANHYKQDRIFQLAARERLPLLIYTEGGGGRPGDTDGPPGVGCEVTTFTELSRLSGLVPMVGIASGYVFAGNTAMLACCDVIIATKGSTIAMGGPAMIEGGGLGVYRPEEVGPLSFQVPNGVVDILVEDEAEATAVAKRYLSYFQGPVNQWTCEDQRKLRHIIPEKRVRMYDMRELIHTLCDTGSVMEIRPQFGLGMVTALVRIEGVPMGLIANNPHHLGGSIDSPGADKAARFLQLCDAFDLPIVSLMDCPGMMVGPEVEKTALVRHCCRLFNTGANLTVPIFGFVVRKAYGLGVQAMMGGSSKVPFFTCAWPTGEFAGMGIEGSVKLGYRNELQKIEDPQERLAWYTKRVEEAYRHARAIEAGPTFGVDDVIDPVETRRWISAGLRSLPPERQPCGWAGRPQKKRPNIDTW